jgi:hypothetical protein
MNATGMIAVAHVKKILNAHFVESGQAVFLRRQKVPGVILAGHGPKAQLIAFLTGPTWAAALTGKTTILEESSFNLTGK